MPSSFKIRYDEMHGLILNADWSNGMQWRRTPIRLSLRGTGVFRVWGEIDSGEGAPVWADPTLDITCFGPERENPDFTHWVEFLDGPDPAYRATAVSEHVRAVLDLRLTGDRLEVRLSVANAQSPSGFNFPLCMVELRFEDLDFGPEGTFLDGHAYGGRTHGGGRLSDIEDPGLPFINGCIGQALPLLMLEDPEHDRGIQWEFMLGERPTVWLKPGSPGKVNWACSWTTDRFLSPGQIHSYPGALHLMPFIGRSIDAMRLWKDNAGAEYGLFPPRVPEWIRTANIIEFNMNPSAGNGFSRLDDPACRLLLERWKAMGYTAIFAVSPNHVGQNWLSPFDYRPCDAVGSVKGEKQALQWAHELGFHIFLWVTTVGLDRDAQEVKNHSDWFTHRPDGSLFYAWESGPPNYVGYAPDADPLSTGWRKWLKTQVAEVIERGYDGIFVDGLIPRASNHARWRWPGEGRGAVEDQVTELSDYVRRIAHGKDLITFVEDRSLVSQVTCEITQGRYSAARPFYKKAYWDHGMGGGPESASTPPERIDPEKARDYLLLRYGSRLPGAIDNDILESYYSEESRPWCVQSILCGAVPKTHSIYADDPATFRLLPDYPEPPDNEREPKWRLQGHEEFLRLLKLRTDDPLISGAPLSIEGVAVAGDDAVVGILRPGPHRCLLGILQFAKRQATVNVRLRRPVDVPALQRDLADRPDFCEWTAREIQRSIVEPEACPDASISGNTILAVSLRPYSFRIFELERVVI